MSNTLNRNHLHIKMWKQPAGSPPNKCILVCCENCVSLPSNHISAEIFNKNAKKSPSFSLFRKYKYTFILFRIPRKTKVQWDWESNIVSDNTIYKKIPNITWKSNKNLGLDHNHILICHTEPLWTRFSSPVLQSHMLNMLTNAGMTVTV